MGHFWAEGKWYNRLIFSKNIFSMPLIARFFYFLEMGHFCKTKGGNSV